VTVAGYVDRERDSAEPVTFDALFNRYARYVAGIAARLMGRDDAEVDDIVQDVFWLASRRIDRLPDMASARGWLAVVTTRVVRRKLMRRRFKGLFHCDQPVGDVPANVASPEQRATLKRVYQVLETLPIEQRLAWSLRYIEGERLECVAGMCGCSLATVKRRIDAAQTIIKEVCCA
jgi:RNA polymerase sigma-70 factor (ECF subfamily)